MKGIIAAVIAIAFITGCTTTPNRLRDGGPDETYVSNKGVKEVAMCIAKDWENRYVVVTRELEEGISVISLDGGAPRYMADVERRGDNAVTYGYYWRVISIGRDPMMAAIQYCQ
ncbi:hypothetical protein [Marinobacter adhaerens]|uniref:hypothetical protein n=1 Tax=Marinobacter adhaerens TaxID=1033846 RepID=UPI001E31F097|nr:hypothetical protein [Marinobacter adhaerens]MCD1646969.1 hypothetical protein [Marinobacter adhaerens]